MKNIKLVTLFFIFNILINTVFAEKMIYKCGIAIGFPPYQFSGENSAVIGIDAEITTLIAKNMKKEIIFIQEPWDELMPKLKYTESIDFLCGAEVTKERESIYDFTIPVYNRNTAIFVREKGNIKNIEDLFGKIVTGDRHSIVEQNMGNDKNKIRIIKTESKEQAFNLLKKGKVQAVIAPVEVGKYISKKIELKVRIIGEKELEAPVAFMIKKGNVELKRELNSQLQILIESGKIAEIMKKYQ